MRPWERSPAAGPDTASASASSRDDDVDPDVPVLLAVDLGLRAGLASFSGHGRLLRYRSTHFPDRARLSRIVGKLLDDEGPRLRWVVVEGDRTLKELFERHAERRAIETRWVSPEAWRNTQLLPRERRDKGRAKAAALTRARERIERDGARRPTSLRHDVAEAILLGAHMVDQLGLGSPGR